MDYKIDASQKVLGRLASEVAMLLRGKNDPRFDPSKMSGNAVLVFNTDKVAVTGKKISPPLNESMEILGKEECLKRLGSH